MTASRTRSSPSRSERRPAAPDAAPRRPNARVEPLPPTLSPQARGEGVERRKREREQTADAGAATSALAHVAGLGFARLQRSRLQMIAVDQWHLGGPKTHRQW